MSSLDAFFNPASVAIVGATEKPGVGRATFENVVGQPGFKGKVYPINPNRPTVLGHTAYDSLENCPTVPDLVIVLVAAKHCRTIVAECVDLGVPAVIIIASGFKEVGPEGAALEQAVYEEIVRSEFRTRIVGPNCFGIMDAHSDLNATFAAEMCLKGNVAFLSQSGAMAACLMAVATAYSLGFSKFVSVGSMMDVDYSELLEHVAKDEETKVVLCYMETTGEARKFMKALAATTIVKPVLVIKAGRNEGGAKAAVSHTGSLAGSDDIVDAALRRAGAMRFDSIEAMFSACQLFSKQPPPPGSNLAILTHAGGPGVVAADAVVAGGCQLAALEKKTIEACNQFCSPFWSHGNPLDITGGAPASYYARILDLLKDDSTVDAIYVFAGALDICPPNTVARLVNRFSWNYDKPIFACYQGGEELDFARQRSRAAGVPAFLFADDGPRAFCQVWNYYARKNMKFEGALEAISPSALAAAVETVTNRLATLQKDDSTVVLTEAASKDILGAYDIPVTRTVICSCCSIAVQAADEMGYPVVVKLHSSTITHKSDVGGVKLNIKTAAQVAEAWNDLERRIPAKDFNGVTVQPYLTPSGLPELFLGCTPDAQYGPSIVVGHGGTFVEVVKDSAIAIPPIDSSQAIKFVKSTKVAKALGGFRGLPEVDFANLGKIIARFSQLVTQHPSIREVDLNPIVFSGDRVIAVDARIVLNSRRQTEGLVPCAIAPYPTRFVVGSVRPAWSSDRERLVKFLRGLPEQKYRSLFLDVDPSSNLLLYKLLSCDYSSELCLLKFESGGDIVNLMLCKKRRSGGVASACIDNSDEEMRAALAVVAGAWI